MISCKTFFQLTVAALKENLNLQLPLRFYISAMFLFEEHSSQNKLQSTG